ncbi:MAG: tetratricopeptide repeat protein [Flavobacterium sp.]|nr:tetratricopeptide repeat protein [Flavobacterium sp.]
MSKNSHIALLVFFLLGFGSRSLAQQNPEDIALEENKTEDYFFEALTQRGIENYDKAIIALQKALEKEPKNAAFLFELGKNQLDVKNYIAAEMAFKNAIEIDAKQRWYWNGLYDIYYQTKAFDKAIGVVQKLVEFDPNMREDLVSLYMTTDQKEKALALLKEMEATAHLTKTMEFYKLKLERSTEFAAPKKETLELGIKEHPKYEQNYIDLINLYLSFNQEDKAFEVARALEKEIPSSEWAAVSLVKFYLNANDGTKASQAMFTVLQSTKMDFKIKHRVFNEFLIFTVNNPVYFKEVDAAIPYFDSDTSLSVASEVAKFFWKKKDLDKAAYYFEKAIQQKPDAVESINYYLEVLQQKQDFQRLVRKAIEFSELFPTQSNYYYYAGWGCNQVKNYQKAKEYLENGLDFVVDDQPLEVLFYEQLIISCENLKDITGKQRYSSKLKQIK